MGFDRYIFFMYFAKTNYGKRQKMKKVVIKKPGGYSRLVIEETADVKPKKGEVLIETRACGVNFADCVIRMGLYRSAKEFVGWPITPGFEVSGVIAALGEGVELFSIGQQVIAITLFGGYTTHLVVSADQVFPMPEFLSFAEAAAIPTVFLTAYYALSALAHSKKGDRILVHSAGGGVGSALVQLGNLIGCRTTGVVGAAHKVEYVKSLGARNIIDKSSQNLWKEVEKVEPGGFDAIFDANGAESLKEDYRHLDLGGKLVIYGFHTMFSKGRGRPNWLKMLWYYLRTPRFNPLQMTNDNHSIMAFNLSYFLKKKSLLQQDVGVLLKWFQEGELKPPIVTTYPFENVIEAQRDLESGQTVGKLVLTSP
jgi:synaptic vesicle membrane protein VAT-1